MTLKDPWCFMDETDTERFGIMSLESLDKELDWCVVHVTQLMSITIEAR